ncbi:tetratricopeptide repeat protein [Rhodobacter sp. KR11]|jgi:Flp pilus assembly protein TadD|uniref:tetratricopeptide repeat protein n=1 Tax=Rhodobacter sp. KR11 TaxID=2974588 RepID=UPI0022224CE7|nr:tetratricopeptide repeat protein [Rhodobacter sp. KR11]MCW1917375.1 tetratricopeptide repeat protein [Rhodobacter sp. KR11]
MRHPNLVILCLLGTGLLAGCQKGVSRAQADRAVAEAQAVDQSNLTDIMLTVADPMEAVNYFKNALAVSPDKIDLKRGLARSQSRAGLYAEATGTLGDILSTPEATDDDRLALADVLIRSNEWGKAEGVLNAIPPTVETYERYRLEAMVADSKKDWKKADSFYSVAVGLTNKPQSILNNWGFSKLTRGDGPGAEKLFLQALTYDSSMFTAKNNLVMSRAMQRKYELPVIAMTQDEKAKLLYTAGLAAVKQGDTTTGKRLLQEAVDTAPTYFEEAARSLAALEGR